MTPVLTLALLSALSSDPALDALADAAAASTARFADRAVAMAEGYRRIGTDFAGMGEHWIHTASLLVNRVDPRRPTMLTYADVKGRPTLLGVGFVVTTQGDAAASAPGWPAHWHEHSGLLADESAANRASRPVQGSATRVWVLHIWTNLPNPHGRYLADNWAVPFARRGLRAAGTVDHASGSAAALTVAGGAEQLKALIDDAGLRPATRAADIDLAIGNAVAEASRILSGAEDRGLVSAADDAALRDAWKRLAAELERLVGPDVHPLMRPPPAHGHATASDSHHEGPSGGGAPGLPRSL